MTNPFQYRDDKSLEPPWLTTGTAERYEYVIKLARDLLVEKANEAIRFRLPGEGDASQLPYLAFDRDMVQGPGETSAQFIARLKGYLPSWGMAGSARAVLEQIQGYLTGLQPGVPVTNPMATIVTGLSSGFATWNQLYQGDKQGAAPTLTRVVPSNFNWDGTDKPWRAFLILPMALVATGLSGASAASGSTFGGSFTAPGQNAGGVWVPNTVGTPVNAPFQIWHNLLGITSAQVGQWLTSSGSGHSGNNGTFQIVQRLSSSRVVVANPNGVAPDAGPVAWSISAYPYIAPGLARGSPGVTYGQGESAPPAKDTGANRGGVWQPTVTTISGLGALTSWGLSASSQVIVSLRQIVRSRKGARTYYPCIIVAFDCGDGTSGNAYSPNSSAGAGNPAGTFGSVGSNVAGVWTPTRLISSTADCYCQGTGRAQACSQENVT